MIGYSIQFAHESMIEKYRETAIEIHKDRDDTLNAHTTFFRSHALTG